MAFEHISNPTLMDILVHATRLRSKRKVIALSVAAENILCHARQDFYIPAERLPSANELIGRCERAIWLDSLSPDDLGARLYVDGVRLT